MFDKWDTPVEFVNLIIEHMPVAYAVPGQHDLPNHRYEDVERSAYWNLVKAGRVVNLRPNKAHRCTHGSPLLVMYGFPWGMAPAACWDDSDGDCKHLAVAHRYVWARPEDNPARRDDEFRVNVVGRAFRGYDAVLLGDNHTPWQLDGTGGRGGDRNCVPVVFNHGTALRRHADEKDLTVGPGVLYDDGSVVRHELKLPPDLWADSFEAASALEPAGVDAAELLALLKRGGDAVVSFRRAVRAIADNPPAGVSPGVARELRGWVT